MRVFPAPAVVLTALAVSRPWVDSTVRSQAAASRAQAGRPVS